MALILLIEECFKHVNTEVALKRLVFVLGLFCSNLVFAAADSAFYTGVYEAPSAPRLNSGLYPHSILVTQWNVYAFNNMKYNNWSCNQAVGDQAGFCAVLKSSDLILLQENRSETALARVAGDAILNLHTMHLSFAPFAVNKDQRNRDLLFMSFDEKAEKGLIDREAANYGSATFSVVAPQTTVVRMTENPDPIYELYMPLIATTYDLRGRSDRLLVIHFHNASMVDSVTQQDLLNKAEVLIAAHQGPVLFAGDFNTWTAAKLNNVYQLANRQGMSKIYFNSPYETPLGQQQMDHAFIRGLALHKESLMGHRSMTGLSDHMAVSYRLSVL